MFPVDAGQQGWPIIVGCLMDLNSDDVVRVVNLSGLTVDWALSRDQDYSHKTRKRAYSPRIQAAYQALDHRQKEAVVAALASELLRVHPRPEEVTARLATLNAVVPANPPPVAIGEVRAPVDAQGAVDVAQPEPQTTTAAQQVRGIVISLHGIRTRGAWQKELTSELQRAGFVHEPLDFGFFRALQLLWPGARQRQVAWFRDEYTRIARESGNHPISVVAHSFGTYIATRALELFPEIALERIILCGSIVREDFPWSRLIPTHRVRQVLNDYGRLDFWAGVVGWVVSDAGRSGKCGFSDTADGAVIQREHQEFRHSDYFYKLNYEKNWIPFLKGKAPSNLLPAEGRPVNWRFRTTWIVVTIVILFLVGWTYLNTRTITNVTVADTKEVVPPSSEEVPESFSAQKPTEYQKIGVTVDLFRQGSKVSEAERFNILVSPITPTNVRIDRLGDLILRATAAVDPASKGTPPMIETARLVFYSEALATAQSVTPTSASIDVNASTDLKLWARAMDLVEAGITAGHTSGGKNLILCIKGQDRDGGAPFWSADLGGIGWTAGSSSRIAHYRIQAVSATLFGTDVRAACEGYQWQ